MQPTVFLPVLAVRALQLLYYSHTFNDIKLTLSALFGFTVSSVSED